MMQCCQIQLRAPSGCTRPASTEDIVDIAKRFPQRGLHEEIAWAYGGGAVSRMFHHERFRVFSLHDGRQRRYTETNGSSRECKDLDLCVLSGDDVFYKDSSIQPSVPFFRRYMSEDGLCVETTRGWFFYSPPPEYRDLVSVDAGGQQVICAGPECLCAAHFKAIIEGRSSSTRDVLNAINGFVDFDMQRFEVLVQRMPVYAALDMDEVREIMKAVREDWNGIRVPSLRAIKRYYSTYLAQGTVYDSLDEKSIRLLANGIGFLRHAKSRGLDGVPKHADDEHALWHAIYAGLGLPSKKVDEIIARASEADNAEIRINNLLAIASSLGKLQRVVHELLLRNGDRDAVLEISKGYARFMVRQLQEDFSHLHPLKSTFRGLLTVAERMVRQESLMAEIFFTQELQKMIGTMAKDAKKIHKMVLDDDR